jgi:hypothetical protein
MHPATPCVVFWQDGNTAMARNNAYEKANQKIEEARRTGATELDLSCDWDAKDSQKLAELPESLGRLTRLQSLNLSDNGLVVLPRSLGQLTRLQALDLDGNGLTELPTWLGQLIALREFYIDEQASVPKWISAEFRVTLWCEHSRLPLPALNSKSSSEVVYELTLPRDWLVKSAPFLFPPVFRHELLGFDHLATA